jgi:hypothetical protein
VARLELGAEGAAGAAQLEHAPWRVAQQLEQRREDEIVVVVRGLPVEVETGAPRGEPAVAGR